MLNLKGNSRLTVNHQFLVYKTGWKWRDIGPADVSLYYRNYFLQKYHNDFKTWNIYMTFSWQFICENCFEVHLVERKKGAGLELILTLWLDHQRRPRTRVFPHGSVADTSTAQKHLRENNRWLWTVVYEPYVPDVKYILVSVFYYLQPTYQRSLSLRALLSPLEQQNISNMLKITHLTRA